MIGTCCCSCEHHPLLTIELVFAPTLIGHYPSRCALLQEVAAAGLLSGEAGHGARKNVLEKLPLSLTDNIVLSIAMNHGWQSNEFMGRITKRKASALAVALFSASRVLLALWWFFVGPSGGSWSVGGGSCSIPGGSSWSSLAALVLRWRLLVLRWRLLAAPGPAPGPSVAAPLAQAVIPMTPSPVPARRSLSFEEARAPRMSSMVLEGRAPPPIMFDQPEQAADNGEEEEEDSADAGLRHEAAGEPDDRVICVICMDVINEHQEEARLPCNHVLHRDCVDRWRSVAGVGEDQCPTHCERSVQQRDQFAPADDERRSENQVVAEEAAAQAIDGQNEFL